MKLSNDDKSFLELYSDSIYDRPSVTIDNVILRFTDIFNNNYRKLSEKQLQVFLSKRNFSPYKDCYSIPGTFIDLNYPLNESVKKCLNKKIGLKDFYYEQLYTFGDTQRDPRTRVISIAYLILINHSAELNNGEWFNISFETLETQLIQTKFGYKQTKKVNINLSNENICLENELLITFEKSNNEEIKKIDIFKSDLSFDHIKIIYYAIERLKNKIEYTDIIFNLMPKNFSLTELKQCFESILQEKLLDANFRRKIANKVIPVNSFNKEKGHRPSMLYTHNISWQFNNIE